MKEELSEWVDGFLKNHVDLPTDMQTLDMVYELEKKVDKLQETVDKILEKLQ